MIELTFPDLLICLLLPSIIEVVLKHLSFWWLSFEYGKLESTSEECKNT
jgi:hypothetical protein